MMYKIILFTFFILGTCIASENTYPNLINDLKSADAIARKKASQKIIDNRSYIINESIKILNSTSKKKEGEEGDHVYQLCELLGLLKSEESIYILTQMIDYKVKLNSGAKRPVGSSFPCAMALIRIGTISVINSQLDSIIKEKNEFKRKLMIWVIYKIAGFEFSSYMLFKRINDTDKINKEIFTEATKFLKEIKSKGEVNFLHYSKKPNHDSQ